MRVRAAATLLCLLVGVVSCGSGETVDVEAAVLRVDLETCQLNLTNQATAIVIGEGLALTVAHSFDGASGVSLLDADGSEVEAELVYLDPSRDIALLSFADDLDVEALTLHSDADDPVDEGRMVTIRDERTTVLPVQLIRRVPVTLDGEGRRDGVELNGSIIQGDSGAPVVDDDGRVIGMVFASTRASETGWAVAGSELVDIAALAGAPIPLTCPAT